MNTIIKTVLLCFATFSLIECTNMTSGQDAMLDSICDNGFQIERGGLYISVDDAVIVAHQIMKNRNPGTKVNPREVKNVYTIFLSNGNPAMYVVNYTNNEGFTIIGASKHYYPILAESEKGCINSDEEKAAMEIWLSEQKASIEYYQNNTEEARKFAELWNPYEKAATFPFTKNGNINAVRSAFIAECEGNGLECYSLSDLENVLPTTVYDTWCTMAAALSNPDYNYLHTSIVTKASQNTHSIIGPLTTTEWGQDAPYNSAIPGTKLVGCVAVAIGQVMKKHKKPTSFNWSAMPDYLAVYDAPSIPLSNLLYTLAEDAGTVYGYSTSSGNDSLAQVALTTKYNYYAHLIPHSEDSTRASLVMGNPVYTGGYTGPDPYANGHSWVCDGVDDVTTYNTYNLYIVANDEPLHYEHTGQPYSSASQYSYWRYNWGQRGSGNGYYMVPQYDLNHYYYCDRSDMIIHPRN